MKLVHPDRARTVLDGLARDEVVVTTTRDELATLIGMTRETLEAVEEWELSTRLGVTPEQAEELLGRLNGLYHSIGPLGDNDT